MLGLTFLHPQRITWNERGFPGVCNKHRKSGTCLSFDFSISCTLHCISAWLFSLLICFSSVNSFEQFRMWIIRATWAFRLFPGSTMLTFTHPFSVLWSWTEWCHQLSRVSSYRYWCSRLQDSSDFVSSGELISIMILFLYLLGLWRLLRRSTACHIGVRIWVRIPRTHIKSDMAVCVCPWDASLL